jgi:hypothetical protein
VPLPTPRPGVLFQPVDDGAVVLDPVTETYFGLNAVGARVWQHLPPVTGSLAELCAALHTHYPDADLDMITTDVRELLGVLAENALVEPPAEPRG